MLIRPILREVPIFDAGGECIFKFQADGWVRVGGELKNRQHMGTRKRSIEKDMIPFQFASRNGSHKGDFASLGGILWKGVTNARRRLLSGEWSQT